MICRADRLTQVRGVGVETSYTLDAVGNRTRELVRDGANAVRRDVSYAYDARQRLVGEIDAVAGRGARYGWDGRGHVIEERRGVASGSAAHVILQSDARMTRYGYDSEGRRIVTELAGEGPIRESYDVDGLRIEREGEGRAERYQYSEGRLLATTNGMNAVTRRLRYAGLGRRVLGPALGLVLGFSGGVSEGYQAHLDALGSALALTRTDGAVAERTRYGVWGEVEARATPDTNLATTPNPLTWQGYVADGPASGGSRSAANDGTTTYYAYQRHYQVGVGRFTSRDPWAGDPNNPITLNEYLGLNANPLAYVDPDGRCGMLALGVPSLSAACDIPDAIAIGRSPFDPGARAAIDAYRQAQAIAAAKELASTAAELGALAGDLSVAGRERLTGEDFGASDRIGARIAGAAGYLSNLPVNLIDDLVDLEMRIETAWASRDPEAIGRATAPVALAGISTAAGGVGVARAGASMMRSLAAPTQRVGSSVRAVPGRADALEAASRVVAESKSGDTFIGPTIGRTGFKTWEDFNAEAYRRYQRYVDEAYDAAIEAERDGLLKGNRNTRVGNFVDQESRIRLSDWLQSEGVPEGPDASAQLNRWLRDPSGSGDYVRPDVRLPGLILDATVGMKPPGTLQLRLNAKYSQGTPITVVRPSQLGGSYTLLPESED
jgi:RHS repeat-associated protein